MGGEASPQMDECISVARDGERLVVGPREREVRSGGIGLAVQWLR
jgi:hypothetical protein